MSGNWNSFGATQGGFIKLNPQASLNLQRFLFPQLGPLHLSTEKTKKSAALPSAPPMLGNRLKHLYLERTGGLLRKITYAYKLPQSGQLRVTAAILAVGEQKFGSPVGRAVLLPRLRETPLSASHCFRVLLPFLNASPSLLLWLYCLFSSAKCPSASLL